ncbi:hypothetical protein IAU60_005056 [Kwoniella sp. DSM 27419]
MQDITSWLMDECQGLSVHDMIKPPELTMLDAMNALQLFDPKMDTGASSPSRPRVFVPDFPYSPEDVCWIMDSMLSAESVYSSMFYHNPHHLANASTGHLVDLVLRAFVLLFCKTIDLAYTELAKGHIKDGEDCWLDHYGIPVRMSDSVEDVDDLANVALDWLEGSECESE